VRVLAKEKKMANVSIGYRGAAVVVIRVVGFKSYQLSRAIEALPDATIWWEPESPEEHLSGRAAEMFSERFALDIALDCGGIEQTLQILKGIATESYWDARPKLGK
jgi:hypothetical protein